MLWEYKNGKNCVGLFRKGSVTANTCLGRTFSDFPIDTVTSEIPKGDPPSIGSGGAIFSDSALVLATTRLLCAMKDFDGK